MRDEAFPRIYNKAEAENSLRTSTGVALWTSATLAPNLPGPIIVRGWRTPWKGLTMRSTMKTEELCTQKAQSDIFYALILTTLLSSFTLKGKSNSTLTGARKVIRDQLGMVVFSRTNEELGYMDIMEN